MSSTSPPTSIPSEALPQGLVNEILTQLSPDTLIPLLYALHLASLDDISNPFSSNVFESEDELESFKNDIFSSITLLPGLFSSPSCPNTTPDNMVYITHHDSNTQAIFNTELFPKDIKGEFSQLWLEGRLLHLNEIEIVVSGSPAIEDTTNLSNHLLTAASLLSQMPNLTSLKITTDTGFLPPGAGSLLFQFEKEQSSSQLFTLPHLLHLNLCFSNSTHHDMEYMSNHTSFPLLKALNISGNQDAFENEDFQKYFCAMINNAMPLLVDLDLSNNKLNSTFIKNYLSQNPFLGRLEGLSLLDNYDIDGNDLVVLFRSPHLPKASNNLKRFTFSSFINSSHLKSILSYDNLHGLQELTLHSVVNGDYMVIELCNYTGFELKKLTIAGSLSNETILHLTTSPSLSTLTHLSLIHSHGFDEEILTYIAQSKYLTQLVALKLGAFTFQQHPDIDSILKLFFTSSNLTTLASLTLDPFHFPPSILKYIGECQYFKNLRYLSIGSCINTFHDSVNNEDFITTLSNSPHLTNLSTLVLDFDHSFPPREATILSQSQNFKHLVGLQLGNTIFTGDCLDSFFLGECDLGCLEVEY